jgi:hypothetical protein
VRRFRADRAKEATPGWIAWLATDDEPVPIEEPPPIAAELDAEIRELAAMGYGVGSAGPAP